MLATVSPAWLEYNPDWNDREELLVFSDWLEERGKDLAARAARLIATGELKPHPFAWSNQGSTEYVWSWYFGTLDAYRPPGEAEMRKRLAKSDLRKLLTHRQFQSLLHALHQPMQSWRDYPNEEAAFRAVLEVALTTQEERE